MDLVQLKKDIKSKKLSNLYIFTGEEIGVMNVYIDKMGSVQRVDSVSSIWKNLTTKSLNKKKRIYCVRDDKEFIKDDKLWATAHNDIKYGTLILLYTDIDKRGKFYKKYKDEIVEFKKMTKAQLVRHIMAPGTSNLKLDKHEAEYLVDACQGDYTQTMLEINKLYHYSMTYTNFYSAVDNLVISPQKYDVFSFIGNLMKGETANTIKQLDYLLRNGESSIPILALMYTNFRNAAQILGMKCDAKEISDRTGINTWQVKQLQTTCGYTQDECIKAMKTIRDVEQGIKTGLYTDSSAAMVAVCLIL